jgi:phosphosulfolactate phosphohydrolase-like enzyme
MATAEFLCGKQFEDIVIVCAGTRENQADEDVLAAGAFIELLAEKSEPLTSTLSALGRGEGVPELSSSASVARTFYAESKSKLRAAISASENARRLLAIPELHDDVAFCLQRDIFLLVASIEADGAIRRHLE